MTHAARPRSFAGPGIMFLSAAIFGFFAFGGYFGVGISWSHTIAGQFLFYAFLLDWTLKISAVAFLVAAIVTFVRPFFGNLLYSIVGLAGAVSFLVVAFLDWQDKQYTTGVPLFLLLLFAAWNGYGSLVSLRELFGHRSGRDPASFPDDEP